MLGGVRRTEVCAARAWRRAARGARAAVGGSALGLVARGLGGPRRGGFAGVGVGLGLRLLARAFAVEAVATSVLAEVDDLLRGGLVGRDALGAAGGLGAEVGGVVGGLDALGEGLVVGVLGLGLALLGGLALDEGAESLLLLDGVVREGGVVLRSLGPSPVRRESFPGQAGGCPCLGAW